MMKSKLKSLKESGKFSKLYTNCQARSRNLRSIGELPARLWSLVQLVESLGSDLHAVVVAYRIHLRLLASRDLHVRR